MILENKGEETMNGEELAKFNTLTTVGDGHNLLANFMQLKSVSLHFH